MKEVLKTFLHREDKEQHSHTLSNMGIHRESPGALIPKNKHETSHIKYSQRRKENAFSMETREQRERA
jgi:hypothetical protein